MKIQIASDLHLEHIENTFPKHHGIDPTDADVLILAGDIHRNVKAVWSFADWKVPVVYVHGNHEVYNENIDDFHRTLTQLSGRNEAISQEGDSRNDTTVYYLERDVYIQDGTRFLGCCLWTDYALIHRDMIKRCMEESERGISDHRLIRTQRRTFTAKDAAQLHADSLTWLGQQLSQPFDGPTVVVTHHGPHYKSVHPRYAGLLINAAFVSDLTDFILKYQPTLWVHGHVHDCFDYMVGNTRVVANPRGYPRNARQVRYPNELVFENPAFDKALVIEL